MIRTGIQAVSAAICLDIVIMVYRTRADSSPDLAPTTPWEAAAWPPLRGGCIRNLTGSSGWGVLLARRFPFVYLWGEWCGLSPAVAAGACTGAKVVF